MIGLRKLSNNRLELFASNLPLEALQPYLLDYYREAFATIVLYEDNPEIYHETGIFNFDASEPVTFNYEEFRAPLVAEYQDRIAICTVENLFLHLQRYMEEKPLEDDPFHNLVFSICLAPPSKDVLLDWQRHTDKRLQRVLFDVKSAEHFQIFPDEVCVVYSHDNHFTSVTSDREDLILAIFEDIVERHLGPVSQPPLPPELTQALYQQLKTYGIIRLKADRLHYDEAGNPFLLVTYPKKSTRKRKRIARLYFNEAGQPATISSPELMPRLRYHLRYSDLSYLPMVLVVSLMGFLVMVSFFFRILFPSRPL